MVTMENRLKYLNNNVITKQEFEKMFHIGHGKSYELLHTNGFPCFKIGQRYFILIDKAIEWLSIHNRV